MQRTVGSKSENRAILRGRLNVALIFVVTTITVAAMMPIVLQVLFGQAADAAGIERMLSQLKSDIDGADDNGLAFVGAFAAVAVAMAVALAAALGQLERLMDRASPATTADRTGHLHPKRESEVSESHADDPLVSARAALQVTVLALLLALIGATSFAVACTLALMTTPHPVPRAICGLLALLLFAESLRGFMAYASLARLQIRATPDELVERLTALSGRRRSRRVAVALWAALLAAAVCVILANVPPKTVPVLALAIGVALVIAELQFRSLRATLLESRSARGVTIVMAWLMQSIVFSTVYLGALSAAFDKTEVADSTEILLLATGAVVVVLLLWRMLNIAGLPARWSDAAARIDAPFSVRRWRRDAPSLVLGSCFALLAVPVFPLVIALQSADPMAWHPVRRLRLALQRRIGAHRWTAQLDRLGVRRTREDDSVRYIEIQDLPGMWLP